MTIITDARDYTEKILKNATLWKHTDLHELKGIPAILAEKLMPASLFYISEVETESLWQFAFIVRHAPQSQFFILMDILKDNTDFKDGIICLADSGQNFRGYRNRKWVSLKGNIHLSVFLYPDCSVKNFHTGFTILSAVSVIETIDSLKGLQGKTAIKWVNDIVMDNAKVSGVLTQTQTQGNKVTGVFLGIGLNVQTTPDLEKDQFVAGTTSLNAYTPCTQAEVLDNLLKNITKNYNILIDGGYDRLLNIYRKRSIILGKEIAVYSDPFNGEPQITAQGKVTAIGENLELFLENIDEPVTKGRIILK